MPILMGRQTLPSHNRPSASVLGKFRLRLHIRNQFFFCIILGLGWDGRKGGQRHFPLHSILYSWHVGDFMPILMGRQTSPSHNRPSASVLGKFRLRLHIRNQFFFLYHSWIRLGWEEGGTTPFSPSFYIVFMACLCSDVSSYLLKM